MGIGTAGFSFCILDTAKYSDSLTPKLPQTPSKCLSSVIIFALTVYNKIDYIFCNFSYKSNSNSPTVVSFS